MMHVSYNVSYILTILKLSHLTYNSLSLVYGHNDYGVRLIIIVWICLPLKTIGNRKV